MELFQFLRDRGSPPSPTDELLYEFVANELANSMVKQGLWTKALSESDWNESKAKASYVRMRIAQLREELKGDISKLQASTSGDTQCILLRLSLTTLLILVALNTGPCVSKMCFREIDVCLDASKRQLNLSGCSGGHQFGDGVSLCVRIAIGSSVIRA